MAVRNNYLLEQVQLGDEVEVFWPADKQYYKGVISQILGQGKYHIIYVDGEEEELRLSTERWRFRGPSADRVSRGHVFANRKRSRNNLPIHEPEPIIIDDDDEDRPPPKRSRHKQTTHHSNKSIAGPARTQSISTQQSDVEIEEVPVQVCSAPMQDHRASDVSEPIVSEDENDMIEEEVLDRGFGGDTSSAADTSEVERRHPSESISIPQHPSTRKKAKTTTITKSNTPSNSANSRKGHRSSFTVQSPALSPKTKIAPPVDASYTNRSKSNISPAPLAPEQLSKPTGKSPKRSTRKASPRVPASVVKELVLPKSKLISNTKPVIRTTSTAKQTALKTTTASSGSSPVHTRAAQADLKASAGKKPNVTKIAVSNASYRTSPQKENEPSCIPQAHQIASKTIGKSTTEVRSPQKEKEPSSIPQAHLKASKTVGQSTAEVPSVPEAKKNHVAGGEKGKTASVTPPTDRNESAELTKPDLIVENHRKSRKNVQEVKEDGKTLLDYSHSGLVPTTQGHMPTKSKQSAKSRSSQTKGSKKAKSNLSHVRKSPTTHDKRSPRNSKELHGLLSQSPVDAKSLDVNRSQITNSSKPTDTDKHSKTRADQNADGSTTEDVEKITESPSAKMKRNDAPSQSRLKFNTINVTPLECPTMQFPSSSKKKPVELIKKANMPAIQRSIRSEKSKQQISVDSGCQAPSAKIMKTKGSGSRSKTKTSTLVSPKKRIRAHLSETHASKAGKCLSLEQKKPRVQHPAMVSDNTCSMLKQNCEVPTNPMIGEPTVTAKQPSTVSVAVCKKSRHPSPKVFSRERIPRNKPLPSFTPPASISCASNPAQRDRSRKQAHLHGPSNISLSSSGRMDQKPAPKTDIKSNIHSNTSKPQHLQPGHEPLPHDTPRIGSLRARTSDVAMEVIPKSSGAEASDLYKQFVAHLPSAPKTSRSISIQSLVSSPPGVTKFQNVSPRSQIDSMSLPSIKRHDAEPLVPASTVLPHVVRHSQAASLPQAYAVPSVSNDSSVPVQRHTDAMLNMIQTHRPHPVSQPSTSIQSVKTPAPPNVPLKDRRKTSAFSVEKLSAVNPTAIKELPVMKTHGSLDVIKQPDVQNGLKRTAELNEKLLETAKKRRSLAITHIPRRHEAVISTTDSLDGPLASSEMAVSKIGRENLDHFPRVELGSVRKSVAEKGKSVGIESFPVPGRTRFLPSAPHPSTSLKPLGANIQPNLQGRVTAVLNPFSNSGHQLASEGYAPKFPTELSARQQWPFSPKDSPFVDRAIEPQRKIVPAHRPRDVHSLVRGNGTHSGMGNVADCESILLTALRTVESNFMELDRKNKELFGVLKESNGNISRALSQLNFRVDKMQQTCRMSSGKMVKALEQTFDKKFIEIGRRIETNLRVGTTERLKLQSSIAKVIERITQTTSALFQSALEEIKKTAEGVSSELSPENDTNHRSSYGGSQCENRRGVGTQSLEHGSVKISNERKTDNRLADEKHLGATGCLQRQTVAESRFELQQTLQSHFLELVSQKQQDRPKVLKPPGIPRQWVSAQSFAKESIDLIARCVTDWLQGGECRRRAPKNERTVPVSQEWVVHTTLQCFKSILDRMQSWASYAEAEAAVAESINGKNVETEWLVRSGNDVAVEKARAIYSKWEPELLHFEWVTEKKVLLEVAKRVNALQKVMSIRNHQFADPLHRAISCVKAAINVG